MSNSETPKPQKDYGEFDPRGWPKWVSVSVAVAATIVACALLGWIVVLGWCVLGCIAYWLKLEIAGRRQEWRQKNDAKNEQ